MDPAVERVKIAERTLKDLFEDKPKESYSTSRNDAKDKLQEYNSASNLHFHRRIVNTSVGIAKLPVLPDEDTVKVIRIILDGVPIVFTARLLTVEGTPTILHFILTTAPEIHNIKVLGRCIARCIAPANFDGVLRGAASFFPVDVPANSEEELQKIAP